MLRRVIPMLAIIGATLGSACRVSAQAPPPPASAAPRPMAPAAHPDSVAAMLPFAKAYLAISALNERADAEYAEPKNKRPEELATLREKFRVARAALFTSLGMADSTYVQLTRRVSSDDLARAAFEAALAKLTAK